MICLCDECSKKSNRLNNSLSNIFLNKTVKIKYLELIEA